MKKIVYTATALLVLASSSASALTFQSSTFSAKTTATTKTTEPGPGTSVVPTCPRHDPNGCGILD